MNTIMLSCESIREEVITSLNEARADFPVFFIPHELHMSPKKLQIYLQGIIKGLYNVSRILLTLGICGYGTLQLTSADSSIILPKCTDCIDLLLSDKCGRINRQENTYFLTKSWLSGKHSVVEEYSFTVDKYGRKMADEIMKTIYRDYKYFTFLDTGTYDVETAMKCIQELADTVGMETNVIKCEYGLLRKMARLEIDEKFVVINPGEVVSADHFELFSF